MEVLKSNFHELFPIIKEAINGADLIALDTELTGLSEQIERIKSFDDPQSRYTKIHQDNPPDDDTKTFVEETLKTIEIWLDNSDKQLIVETPTLKQKRLIFQEFRARYKKILSAESRPKSILFEKLTDAQKDKKSKEEAAEALAASINFRTIIELLVESDKPLVGHNCFLDMCQLVQQFWTELPEKLKEWKKLNSVQDILQVVQTEPFEKFAPKIEMDQKFTRYTLNDDSLNHEAGYDAYITGYNFIRLASYMFYEKEEKVGFYDELLRENINETLVPDEFVYSTSPDEENADFLEDIFTSEKLTRFYNKLHLLRSDFKFICLDGEDGYPPTKPNGFLLSNIPTSCNHVTLYALFGVFGSIFFQWIDDTHCWLIVKDDKKVSKVPKGVLGRTKLFSLFLEGGKNYDLALEKGITKEMGEICIQSWSDWVKSLLYADSEDEKEEGEKRNSGTASMDDVRVENGFDNNQVEIQFEIKDTPPAPHDESSWGRPREDKWADGDGNNGWLKKEVSACTLEKDDTWANNADGLDCDDIKDAKNVKNDWGTSSPETLNISIKRALSNPQPPVEEEESDTEMNGAFKKTRIG
ncbi:4364_t:CDS:10 [Acaulospora colombiana]|uniref:4364_t:CDS:1 n=1 Tax=Acaulospora colombiana TaxID=27376 RepID=A0ACA9KM66_9GLOM|nr:4364_t:CDS:10 [Acaulospora colombiana]